MKNVQLVTKNPEKFVNYSKSTAIEAHEKRFSPSKSSQIHFMKSHEQIEEEYEQEKTDDCIEYIEEELEIVRADQQSDLIDINEFCRLCTRNFDIGLVSIFDEHGNFTDETECLKVMPPKLITLNDGLPQQVCVECLEKLQSCATIIDGFVMNQSLFVSE